MISARVTYDGGRFSHRYARYETRQEEHTVAATGFSELADDVAQAVGELIPDGAAVLRLEVSHLDELGHGGGGAPSWISWLLDAGERAERARANLEAKAAMLQSMHAQAEGYAQTGQAMLVKAQAQVAGAQAQAEGYAQTGQAMLVKTQAQVASAQAQALGLLMTAGTFRTHRYPQTQVRASRPSARPVFTKRPEASKLGAGGRGSRPAAWPWLRSTSRRAICCRGCSSLRSWRALAHASPRPSRRCRRCSRCQSPSSTRRSVGEHSDCAARRGLAHVVGRSSRRPRLYSPRRRRTRRWRDHGCTATRPRSGGCAGSRGGSPKQTSSAECTATAPSATAASSTAS